MIGNKIKLLRKANHISQKTLSEALMVKQSTIANYEKDVRSPNIEMLIAIADYFKVSIDELVGNKLSKKSIITLADDYLNYLLLEDIENAEKIAIKLLNETDLRTVFYKLFRYALTKLGWLWEVGEISIAKEHQISYEISRMVNKFQIDTHSDITKSRVIGMVAPGEKHTFGLQMTLSLLKSEGFKTMYIGEAVPVEDLNDYISKGKYDYLILSITSELWTESLMTLIDSLENIEIYVVGSGAKGIKNERIQVYSTYEVCLEAFIWQEKTLMKEKQN